MIGVLRLGNVVQHRLFLVEGDDAAVDDAGIAFAAAGGHFHAGIQQVGGVAATHDGGHAHFARHDGRVTGATAFVGDDGAGLLHDRLPIGVGHVGHQHIALLEVLAVGLATAPIQTEQDAHLATADAVADGDAGGDDLLARGTRSC
jgi:hypothetical protein